MATSTPAIFTTISTVSHDFLFPVHFVNDKWDGLLDRHHHRGRWQDGEDGTRRYHNFERGTIAYTTLSATTTTLKTSNLMCWEFLPVVYVDHQDHHKHTRSTLNDLVVNACSVPRDLDCHQVLHAICIALVDTWASYAMDNLIAELSGNKRFSTFNVDQSYFIEAVRGVNAVVCYRGLEMQSGRVYNVEFRYVDHEEDDEVCLKVSINCDGVSIMEFLFSPTEEYEGFNIAITALKDRPTYAVDFVKTCSGTVRINNGGDYNWTELKKLSSKGTLLEGLLTVLSVLVVPRTVSASTHEYDVADMFNSKLVKK